MSFPTNLSAAVSTSIEGCLSRMAATIDPIHAIDKKAPKFGTNICHGLVAAAIKKRENMDDLIWLYGTKDNKVAPIVEHSVLTNEDHDVIADSFKNSGKFKGAKGYERHDAAGNESYELVDVLPVHELFDDYLDYSLTASAESDADKKANANIDLQLENNKEQQKRLRESKGPADENQKLQIETQINNLERQAIDLKKRKSEG
jgi:hypothetical protein